MYLVFYVLLIVVLLAGRQLSALDVSFLPNDENAPLPLSAKYRDALRRLCVLLEENRNLPKELEAKKPVLRNLCKKLRLDDENIAQGMQESQVQHSVVRSFLYLAVTVGSGYFLFQHKEVVWLWAKKVWTSLISLVVPNKRYSVGRVVGQYDASVDNTVAPPAAEPSIAAATANREVPYDLQAAREARLRRFASIAAGGTVGNNQ